MAERLRHIRERVRGIDRTAASLYAGVATNFAGQALTLAEVGGQPDINKPSSLIGIALMLIGSGFVGYWSHRTLKDYDQALRNDPDKLAIAIAHA